MNKQTLSILLAFACVALALSACGPSPAELTATTAAARAQTETAAPTATLRHTPTLTPTPTRTPRPTTTPRATPTPPATPLPVLLLDDSFDNNLNGWDVFSDSSLSAAVTQGQYRIEFNDKAWTPLFWSGITTSPDSDMSFDASWEEGTGDYVIFGTLCRFQGPADHYYLLVAFTPSSDGFFVGKRVLGEDTSLASGTLPRGILNRHSPNRIRVICSGDVLELSANGKVLATVHDADLGSGLLGLDAEASASGFIVTFDNVEVRTK